jgi:hypothetical protein
MLMELASMELPTSWAAARHELRVAELTASQQLIDLRCGFPKFHDATEFAPSSERPGKPRKGARATREEKATHDLAKLGIHYMFALPDGVTCPTDVPTKYACSVESAVATGMPVKIWVLPFKGRHTCPTVSKEGYALMPLEIDSTSLLGRWYHEHRHALWTQQFPNQAYRSTGQQGDLSIVADFLRLYVLRNRGGGTYMDMDVHVLDPVGFNHLPESVAAQEQPSSLKFHGLHRYNNAYLRLRNTSYFTRALEDDWVTEWSNRGKHRGYTGPALVTRVVDKMLENNHCAPRDITLLSMESVFGQKIGDEDIPGAASFHSKLDYWLLDGEQPGLKRALELQRSCPNVWKHMSTGDWKGRVGKLQGLNPP